MTDQQTNRQLSKYKVRQIMINAKTHEAKVSGHTNFQTRQECEAYISDITSQNGVTIMKKGNNYVLFKKEWRPDVIFRYQIKKRTGKQARRNPIQEKQVA